MGCGAALRSPKQLQRSLSSGAKTRADADFTKTHMIAACTTTIEGTAKSAAGRRLADLRSIPSFIRNRDKLHCKSAMQ
jgi:hypothetical protein